jgi:IS30 family transposase
MKIEKENQLSWYYCDPYCSNQRWSNEENNWIIRIFYPNGTDFTKITDEEVQIVQDLINKKPRKILWYRTPYEVFHGVKN